MLKNKRFKRHVKFLIKNGIIPCSLFEKPFWLPKGDKAKIKSLKNAFSNHRCFIIGNGPSLNKIDIKLLTNEFTFGVNSIFLKSRETGFKPTFYVIEDSHVMSDNRASINDYAVDYKFIPTEYSKQVTNPTNVIFYNMNRGFYQEYSKNYEVPRFSKKCDKVLYCGQSVTMINLQLAYYMGFKEVFLIGMDFEYIIPESAIIDGANITSTEDDPNHFDPSYFGAGKKWHDPKLHNVLKSYQHIQRVYLEDNKRIYNATKGGKLEVFPRVTYEELF